MTIFVDKLQSFGKMQSFGNIAFCTQRKAESWAKWVMQGSQTILDQESRI